MYRSNDIVQLSTKSIFIRPFVKVGEKAKSVKVFQYFLEDTNSHEVDLKVQHLQRMMPLPWQDTRYCGCVREQRSNPEEDCCMRKKPKLMKADGQKNKPASMSRNHNTLPDLTKEESKQQNLSIFSRVANLFIKRQTSDTCPRHAQVKSELQARKRQVGLKDIKRG